MDLFSAAFFSSLFSIVLIDLVLGGDNAIVIGLAARNLPKNQQKRAIIWGTFGALIVRVSATAAVVWLLKIPGLLLAGGVLLIWMAFKLLSEEKDENCSTTTCDNLWAAIRTIVIADAAMGIDNVLAVAGASHGSIGMVVLGLLISIPIVVWGSTLVIKVIDRFPVIIYLGAGAIAYTAAKMITHEPFIRSYFEHNPAVQWSVVLVVTMGVILVGRWRKQRRLDSTAT